MKIKEGFNSKELSIVINGNSNGSIELWLNLEGLPDEKYRETLSYMSLQELAELKKMCEMALKDALNL